MTFKPRHPWTLAIVACVLTCAAPAHAVQFRVLGWASADINLQIEINKKATEVSVFTGDLSPFYESQGNGPLVFYKMVDHEGEPRKQTACTVSIPAELERGILLLIPGDDTKAIDRKVLPNRFGFVTDTAPLIYDYIWLDDSLIVRPMGTLEFLNLSHLSIALELGQHQMLLTPQAKAQIPLIAGAKRMAFKAAAQINGHWRTFASNPLPTRGPDRMLVILRDGPPNLEQSLGPNGPNISIVSLFDWPQPIVETGAPVVSNRH